jgi:hypothetical protein
MLNRLAILACFAIAVNVSCQPNKTARDENQPTKQSQPTVTAADGKDKQSTSYTNQPKASGNAPAGNASFKRSRWWSDSNWWLVIAAFATGGVVAWQAWGTKKAADAALLNAQAVINTERAKLLFEFERIFISEDIGGRTAFRIYATNYGRSPAELLSIRTKEDVINSLSELLLVANIPSEAPTRRFLPPAQRYEAGKFIPITPESMVKSYELFKRTGLGVPGQIRVIYGEIAYRDGIAPEPRVSRFCFRYVAENGNETLTPHGPPEYNEYT